jgi:hypothetical protein
LLNAFVVGYGRPNWAAFLFGEYMGMKRPKGKVAESMERSRDVCTGLEAFKGTRAGAKRHGSVDPGWGVFKGTRAGRNPDRPQKDMVGVTMPARNAGVPTFKSNLNEHRMPEGPHK